MTWELVVLILGILYLLPTCAFMAWLHKREDYTPRLPTGFTYKGEDHA